MLLSSQHSALVRFRPTGPWRFGPDSGAREHVDPVLHSDAMFSAVSNAMSRLGMLEDWLRDTVQGPEGIPAVRFSSLFPYNRDLLFVVPPRGIWPPPPSTKIRYKGARFVPLSMVESLLADKPIDEDRWRVDGASGCIIPSNWNDGPFRTGLRSNAAVDRQEEGRVEVHQTACLEFARDSGLWMIVVFSGDEAMEKWQKPLRGALRLLADSGIGGERSRGWGRSTNPKWEKGDALQLAKTEGEQPEIAHWLLSVYLPNEADAVDWDRGNYTTLTRSGRTESPMGSGEAKARTLMIQEGSVLLARNGLNGQVRDVAPQGFPHPVYRSGFAVSIPIPWRVPA